MADEMNLEFEEVKFQDIGQDEFPVEEDDPLDALPPAKKSMVLFFVIDVSSSMKGEKIKTLNEAMRDVLPELIGVGGTETNIQVAVLAFSSGFEWITAEPMILEEYQNWRDLDADGVTDLGAALTELNSKMSRKSFLQSPSLSFAPVIFLMTDGCPTDNYKAGLELLRKNNWFKNGIKIALALGKSVDMEVLEEFTGDKECVLTANNVSQLRNLVRAISVTSSQIGSTSSPVSGGSSELTAEDVNGRKQDMMKDALLDIKQDIMLDDAAEGVDSYDAGW